MRDRIVIGIRDSKLSEELQLEADLTLDSCIMKVQQSESVKKQQDVVRGDRSDKITIEEVKSRNQRQTRRTTGLAELMSQLSGVRAWWSCPNVVEK